MAKIFSITFNNTLNSTMVQSKLRTIVNWLSSYKVSANQEIKHLEYNNTHTFIIGYNNTLNVTETKGYLGFVNEKEDWQRLQSYPDGNYFIYRYESDKIEIASDLTASRSIWYTLTKDAFIYSSSQAAIVNVLGDFNFNKDVIPWVLSSGTLGPGYSWDRRIKFLERGTIATLDIHQWALNFIKPEFEPRVANLPETLDYNKFDSIVKDSIDGLKINRESTGHLLSGGIESRLLLYFVAIPKRLKAFTWSTKESEGDKLSDVAVARVLAKNYLLDHEVFSLSNQTLPAEKLIDLFLTFGEGRVDHIGGYTDGFALWKKFKEYNINTIIRGDHNFGRYKVLSEEMVRDVIGYSLLKDYANTELLSSIFTQDVPKHLMKKPSESLNEFSEKVGIDYRHQYINSALNDLKLDFVEVNNPLLNNRMIHLSASIPSHKKEGKQFTRSFIISKFPKIAFAKSASKYSIEQILARPDIKEAIISELRKSLDSGFWSLIGLPTEFIESLIIKVEKPIQSKNQTSSIKKLIPKSVKKIFLPV